MSKTYTGGYRLVSLAFIDLALASTAIAVAGLGDALGVKSRKRVVLTDIVVSGEKKNDLSVQVKKDGNNYVIEDVYGYDLSIDASGDLTSSEHSSGAGGAKIYKHYLQNDGHTMDITFISPIATPLSYDHQEAFALRVAPAFKSGEATYSIVLSGGGPSSGVYVTSIVSSNGSLAFDEVSYLFSTFTDTVTEL